MNANQDCFVFTIVPCIKGAGISIQELSAHIKDGIVIIDPENVSVVLDDKSKIYFSQIDGAKFDEQTLVLPSKAPNSKLAQIILELARKCEVPINAADALLTANKPYFDVAAFRKNNHSPLKISVSYIKPHENIQKPLILLLISDPLTDIRLPLQYLKNTYNFTDKECEFAQYFVSTLDLNKTATAMHIQSSTARQYLKSLMRKTDQCKQTSLIKMLYHLSDPSY